MNKLTDLEICKRIAEIDGVFTQFVGGRLVAENDNGGIGKEYNPLTNKALLFDLMVKYRVNVVMNDNVDIYEPDKSRLSRAILTAIIEISED